MLLSYVVNYRLDLALFAVLVAVGIFLSRRSVRLRRRANERLPRGVLLLVVFLACLGGTAAEWAGRHQRNTLVAIFAGFGPTYAHQLHLLGHANIGLETKS